MHWLLRRLDRERELICDEAAVALGADPLAYARLLLDLARRPALLAVYKLFSFGAAHVPRAADGCGTHRTTPGGQHEPHDLTRAIRRRVGLATMTLCFAVIAGGIGVAPARPSRTTDERAEASQSKVQPNAGQARRIEGVVLRPDGKPANGATVVTGIMDATHNHAACTTE